MSSYPLEPNRCQARIGWLELEVPATGISLSRHGWLAGPWGTAVLGRIAASGLNEIGDGGEQLGFAV